MIINLKLMLMEVMIKIELLLKLPDTFSFLKSVDGLNRARIIDHNEMNS